MKLRGHVEKLSALVGVRGFEARDVIIDGKIVIQDGVVKTMDEAQIVADAQKAGEQLMANSYMDLKEADSHFLDL